MSKILLIIFFSILVVVYAYFYTKNNSVVPIKDISTFEECAAAGYPIMESYPERCSVPPGGGTFTRATTDEMPTPITLTGTYTCLPKVDTGGPVTLECAFGLKTDEGYYSLDMSSILTDNYPTLYGNETITVEGVLVPKAMLSSDRWKTYDVVGVISVDKVTK
jgi:hypothetical protein